VRALLGQSFRGGAADAAAGSGDQRDSPTQVKPRACGHD
jgi:hypothetical protein